MCDSLQDQGARNAHSDYILRITDSGGCSQEFGINERQHIMLLAFLARSEHDEGYPPTNFAPAAVVEP